jgi:4a-hydroxytetrahydrobiopterin dehydratase
MTRPMLLEEHAIPNAPKLSDADVRVLLGALRDWKAADGAIARRFTFADFHHTIAFVNAVAWIAHREDHHPDLDVGYDHCAVTWSTHSAGGLTRNDFICAARVEALVDA